MNVITDSKVRTKAYQELEERIKTRQARCGVIGLGYVGLPLGLTLHQAGFDVTGIDIDANRVQGINDGTSYITDISDAELKAALTKGSFRATSNLSVIGDLDAISICVPTPLRKTKDPDMSYIVSATEAIARELRPGQLLTRAQVARP